MRGDTTQVLSLKLGTRQGAVACVGALRPCALGRAARPGGGIRVLGQGAFTGASPPRPQQEASPPAPPASRDGRALRSWCPLPANACFG